MTKNTFDIQKSVQENLSEEDQKMYGAFARCPEGYSKIDVLGKGGCAVVWLCQDKQTGQLVAVKQFPKCKSNETNLKSGIQEYGLNKKFFNADGSPNFMLEGHPGIISLCRMFKALEDKSDLWLVFELCGQPLSKILFKQKGTFYKGERIYEVQ